MPIKDVTEGVGSYWPGDGDGPIWSKPVSEEEPWTSEPEPEPEKTEYLDDELFEID